MRKPASTLVLFLLIPLFPLSLPGPQAVHAVTSPVPDPITTIGVWSPSHNSGDIQDPTLTPGSSFTVNINITAASVLTGYQVALVYDPAILQTNRVSFNNTIFSPNPLFVEHETPGQSFFTVYGRTNFNGSGVLARVELSVLGLGSSGLSLDWDRLYPEAPRQLLHGCFHNMEPRVVAPDFATSPNPGFTETSEYMIGSVAVGIILPESDGPEFNWTDSEVKTTVNGILQGMDWWSSQEPKAHLQFSYDQQIRVPTSYEPIRLNEWDDQLWIDQVMTHLGYTLGDAYTKVRTYNNDIRSRLGTDWAFTIFVVDTDGTEFASGGYAHAFLGGPWVTMSRFGRNAYNSGDYYAAVPAHETGHIFYATDEYDVYRSYSGYLNSPDNDGVMGIMNQNSFHVSSSTRRQIGWTDCDLNGVLDIFETKPALRLDPFPSTLTGTSYTFTGTAVDVPYPRASYGRDVSINKIHSVQYGLDNSPSIPASPSDGSFDTGLETFTIPLDQLASGHHTLTVNATNTAGNSAVKTFQFTVPAPVGSFSVEMVRWEARPDSHHLDLDKVQVQTFLFLARHEGTVPAYLYIHLTVNSPAGSLELTSQVYLIGGGETNVYTVVWVPPDRTQRYTVHSTLYYSSSAQGTEWHLGGEKDFSFGVVATGGHPVVPWAKLI